MNRSCLIFIALISLSSTPLFARIGDTQATIEQSLGPGNLLDEDAPFKVPAVCTFRAYSKGDLWCGIYFAQRKSICECYGKAGHALFSKVELEAILSANSGGKNWSKITGHSITSWQIEDKSIVASYPLGSSNLLVISTPSFDLLTAQEAEAQDKKRIGDFFAAATPMPAPSTPRAWPDSAFKTPKPPYPAQARMSHITGSTKVRFTTDASGNVSSIVIVKSAGSAILDSNTQSYVTKNWKGPPNSTHETEFTYQFQ